jgi:hypothetical protein
MFCEIILPCLIVDTSLGVLAYGIYTWYMKYTFKDSEENEDHPYFTIGDHDDD